jgi:hypothetical protein
LIFQCAIVTICDILFLCIFSNMLISTTLKPGVYLVPCPAFVALPILPYYTSFTYHVFHFFLPLFSCLLSHLSCVLCTQYAQSRSLLFSSMPSFSNTLHFVYRTCPHFVNHFEFA